MHAQPAPAHPLAAVTHPDPYPYYAALARRSTLAYDEGIGLWIAARPDLVRAVMAHPACRVRPAHEPVPAAIAGPAGDVFGALVRMQDGEVQARHKAALVRALQALAPGTVARCAREVAALLLADGVGDAGRLNGFVSALPVCTVARLLGVGESQLAAVAAWTGQFVACLSPLSDAQRIAQSHAGAQALLAVLADLVSQAPPGATGLLPDLQAGAWADERALLSNLLGLLSQSYEATAGLLGNCIVALLGGAAPDGLVQRTMRVDPAIHNTRRFAAAEASIGGVTVRAGEAILLILATEGAANGFGHGRHACPGQALAGTIVSAGAQALLNTHPLPRVRWQYRPSVNARIPHFMETPQ